MKMTNNILKYLFNIPFPTNTKSLQFHHLIAMQSQKKFVLQIKRW